MNAGNTVFSQLMSLIPDYELRKCIVIGLVLFERTPLNELFDKPIINQNPEDDRQLSLW